MRRYIYIDTENRSTDTWANHIHLLTPADTIYLICTNHSAKFPLPLINDLRSCKADFIVINVDSGTPNALDFVLVSVLAEKLITAKKSQHIILSGDRGYIPAIKYHTAKGLKVCQCKTLREILEQFNKDSTAEML